MLRYGEVLPRFVGVENGKLGEVMARSLVATEIGVKRAKEALIDLGITQTVLAEKRLKYSRSTVSNFFNRKPIAHENFTEICKILNLEWRDIAEIAEGEATQDDEQESSPKVASSKSAKQEFQQIDDKVKQVEKQIRLAFAIAGTVNRVDEAKLNAIVKLLRQITGDASIEIVDIQEGSIKLILTGKTKALVKILTLYTLREFREVEGINIEYVEFAVNDFSGVDLSGVDLSETNFSEAKFIEAILIGANLSRANLSRASLSRASLSGTNLSGADLSIAKLIETILIGANLSKTNLSLAILSKANLSLAILSGANLSGANLIGADLIRADLSEAIISEAILSKANLSGANLIGADLSGATLWRSNLIRASLIETNFIGANLKEANLSQANLMKSDLRRAILMSSILRGAILNGVDLSGADLNGADLIGVDFRKAILNEANVKLTRFGDNKGISEEMKRDLISRGAIFDDWESDESQSLTPSSR